MIYYIRCATSRATRHVEPFVLGALIVVLSPPIKKTTSYVYASILDLLPPLLAQPPTRKQCLFRGPVKESYSFQLHLL